MENDGLYATFNTNIGEFTASIFFEEVPVTAGNFIGLSEGVIEYTDPSTNQKQKTILQWYYFSQLLKIL